MFIYDSYRFIKISILLNQDFQQNEKNNVLHTYLMMISLLHSSTLYT